MIIVAAGHDVAPARVELRELDHVLHRLGAGREEADASGPAADAQVFHDELGRARAVFGGQSLPHIAELLRRLADRLLNARMPVSHVDAHQLIGEVEDPCAAGEGDIAPVGAFHRIAPIFLGRGADVENVVLVPAAHLVPIDGLLVQTGTIGRNADGFQGR